MRRGTTTEKRNHRTTRTHQLSLSPYFVDETTFTRADIMAARGELVTITADH